MKNLTYEEKKEILDFFKEEINKDVVHSALSIPLKIVKHTITNQVTLENYKTFSALSNEQEEKIHNLLSETTLDTMFNLLKMFEDYKDDVELIIRKNNNEYNMVHLSEKMDNEIAFYKDIIERKQSIMQKVTYEEAKKLTYKEREKILDFLGEKVIEYVRDKSLKIAIETVKNNTNTSKYKIFSKLSNEQQEKICDLLSETILDIIFDFLRMMDYYYDCNDNIELHIIIKKDGKEYNMYHISEYMGSEIACYGDEGWIQKFSKVGRFVL